MRAIIHHGEHRVRGEEQKRKWPQMNTDKTKRVKKNSPQRHRGHREERINTDRRGRGAERARGLGASRLLHSVLLYLCSSVFICGYFLFLPFSMSSMLSVVNNPG